jgi:DUF4097 and DUF4098 domain-containing protein YvlB
MRKPAIVALLTLAVAAASGCDLAMMDFKEQATERWTQTYELQAGGRFELQNVNGRIDVQPSDGRAVEVVAEKTARAGSAEMAKEALGRVRIEATATPQVVRIETRTDGADGFFNRSGNVNVRYTVRVPAGTHVDVRTTNGGIDLMGVRGPAKLSATNGGIRARDVAGALEARTTNGGLEIDLATVDDGGVRLGCTNGGIDVRLPAEARATIDASITNGGISTGNLRLDTVESSRRRLDATLNGGGPRIEIRGTNGGISLTSR